MIAKQITEAAREGGRVVAIVGNKHAENIPDHLPEDVPDPNIKSPQYPFLSIPSLKELVYPGFVFFSVLYVFYTSLLLYVQILQIPLT
jgi:pheromone shutdown protein TraB